jgi:rod shape determining protein RodA
MQQNILYYWKKLDKTFLLIMLVISSCSVFLLRTIPAPASGKQYYMTMLVAVMLGYCGAFVITVMDYHDLSVFWYIIGGFCIFLMLYTLKFGHAVTNTGGVNAKAWISLGSTSFQPSELVKIGFMLTFSTHLAKLEENGLLDSPLHIVLLGVHAIIPIVLTHLQGDDGAGMIFFCMFLFMSFLSGIRLRYFLALFGLLGAAVPLAWKYVLEDYQKERILVAYHLDDSYENVINYGWQQYQARTSVGSGQLTGRGLFVSPRVNSGIVPEQESDMIFSAVGEQLGFIGCCAVIVLFLLLLWRTIHIARKCPDLLGRSICMGFFGMIVSQMVFNLAMCLDLLPVMGVTLPFFSAGGTSAACLYFGFGLVENVAIHRGPVLQTRVVIRANQTRT